MKRMLPAAAAAVVLGSLTLATAQPGAAPSPAAAKAFAKGNCNLCHAVPGIDVATKDESCTGCHIWIRDTSRDPAKRETAMQYFPLWERYEKNVASYLEVPSLSAAMARLEPAWIESYLADPHDVRPGLPEGMPRFGLDAADRAAIAQAFATHTATVDKTPKPTKKNLDKGKAKLVTSGCTACHGFGAAVPASPGIAMAPDLAHVRARMSPDMTVAWIMDPRKIAPSSTMMSFGVSLDDAVAIRDYLFLADPEWTDPPPPTADPQPTKDPVTWAQVEERVFGKICAHCHMDPSLPANQGRRGPGNAGGFGFPETGIHLQSPEGIRPHAEKIGPALLRRRQEAQRDTVQRGQQPKSLTRPEKPGMPLGLPPLPDEDISLVLGWIEQGMPE
ncbi:MAG: hypothetical protein H6737_03495 [Alphaproteobacteria bacterium]|nr:hypothetical protein [Alphaproteobacteria bacterium]